MELATDIMAIIGWALLGGMSYELFTKRIDLNASIFLALSFGLIAASFVLG